MKTPFPIDPVLTGIAIAYSNRSMIADDVLPRVPVGKEEFKYTKYSLAEGFTVPDTKVGRKSKPNEIEFTGEEVTDSTEDFGLDDPIPMSDITNAPENYNPEQRATEQLTNIVELDRELRVAGKVFNAANYSAANKIVLSGTDQWSDFTNSDPIGDIMLGLDSCIMRPNIGILGRATMTKLAQHPDVVKATNRNSGDKGIAQREAIAALLELEEVLVGESFVNNARKGQAASIGRAWGKHAAFIYRDKMADNRNGTTFGFTAQFGTRVAGSKEDSDIGLRGGMRVRSGESVKEVLTATDLGYFIQDAVG